MKMFSPHVASVLLRGTRVVSCQLSRYSTIANNANPGDRIRENFGFQKVNEDAKQTKVDEVFFNVAEKYDIMNDVMSFGIHRVWKDKFVEILNPVPGTKLIDMAGGTGDIAFRALKYLRQPESKDAPTSGSITVCDINPAMLAVGKERSASIPFANDFLVWKEANAEKLPFEDNQFSAYTIAFGIRNVTNIDKVLTEAYRVLQPGGRFMCLEFSQVNDATIKKLYDFYSFEAIPVLGYLVAGQWQAYQYLVESIRNFPDQENFKNMISAAGFRGVTYQNMSFGVVAIHSGFKL